MQELFGGVGTWENGMTLTAQNLSDFLDSEYMLGRTYRIEGKGIDANDLKAKRPLTGGNVDIGFATVFNRAPYKRVESIKEAALNGQLAEGSVVDFNYGEGSNYYVYLNDKFYKLKHFK